MDVINEEMIKKYAEGVASVKARIREELINAIKEGESEKLVQILIRTGGFTEKEIEEIYELKDMSIVQREIHKQFARGVASVRSNIRQKFIIAIKQNKPSEWLQELIDLGRFTDQEVKEIFTESRE